MEIAFSIIFGLIIGSFLSVCIYRLPYGRPKGPPCWDEEGNEKEEEGCESSAAEKSLSIVSPARSICPHCGKTLLWWHNIPVISFIILKGRCAFCGAAISFRYPLVELLSALFCLSSVYLFDFSLTALVVYSLFCALIVISFIDIEYYIIPDIISLPGTALGIALAILNHFTGIFAWPLASNVWSSIFGAALGAGILFAISELYFRLRKRVGLGMGDVKLLALTGAFLGPLGSIYTIFLGSLAGAVIGILLIILSGKKFTHQLPFGPYLALGTAVYVFLSNSGLGWGPGPTGF